MIKGFEIQTEQLNEYELNTLLPVIVRGLRTKIGSQHAITNKKIVEALKNSYALSEARVRKVINHIRTNDIIPGLIATSEGYFIAETEEELSDYEDSLKGRENAIREVRLSIERQRRQLFHKNELQELF